jgi:hypothetical protein
VDPDRQNITVCPTCRSYFTENIIALSLPIPVLQYLQEFITDTPESRRKPLHEVRRALVYHFKDSLNLHCSGLQSFDGFFPTDRACGYT